MAKFYDDITPHIHEFIHKQHVFFVATAPLDGAGHVNVSPKGLDSFRILSPTKVAYLDMTGSGNETSAHITENGRITFMFCSFEGPCDIIRLYGIGRTVLPGDTEWDELAQHFNQVLGQRQIIVADIHRTQTSCGYAVPLFDYVGDRDTLNKW
ncbi:pyridoxamine 5'-phosphate oxidase family protein, partial [Candidatus Saccharibacteria bacterium]|nr:pyridoxamine 5'-phosphate oxidase family protein [Candidatus Saccharibacteria bacterium]